MIKKNQLLSTLLILLMITLNISSVQAKPSKFNLLPPSNLYINSISETNVTFNFNNVNGATGYYIYKSTSTNTFSKIASTSQTYFTDTNLLPNTNYTYYVKAYSRHSISSASSKLTITTKAIISPVIEPEPPVVEPTKKVLGYATYYYNGDSSSYNSMTTNSDLLDKIATHTYITDSYGNLNGLVPKEQITYAKNNGIEVLAMVSNKFDAEIAKSVLENSTYRQALIQNIVTQLTTYNYDGVNIDIEGLYASNRSHLTLFMKELYEKLNPLGLKVTMAVPAKTYDNPSNSWSGAFDYQALNNYSDEIVLMTYDEHYAGGTPGAVASIGWVRQVVDYATTVIPPEKLILGIAAYGYDWSSKGTKAYGVTRMYEIANTYGAQIIWDSVSQTPYFTYVDADNITHTVWFENEYSVPFKLNLVNEKNLQGVAIWKLGLENAAYMNKIRSKLK